MSLIDDFNGLDNKTKMVMVGGVGVLVFLMSRGGGDSSPRSYGRVPEKTGKGSQVEKYDDSDLKDGLADALDNMQNSINDSFVQNQNVMNEMNRTVADSINNQNSAIEDLMSSKQEPVLMKPVFQQREYEGNGFSSLFQTVSSMIKPVEFKDVYREKSSGVDNYNREHKKLTSNSRISTSKRNTTLRKLAGTGNNGRNWKKGDNEKYQKKISETSYRRSEQRRIDDVIKNRKEQGKDISKQVEHAKRFGFKVRD